MIAAVSSRPFVKAAVAAGYSVVALDVFADADTMQVAEQVYKIEYANCGFNASQFEVALAKIDMHDMVGFAYGSGFEAQPDLLERISEHLPLIGNLPKTVRDLKDAPKFFQTLDALSIPHPEVHFKPLLDATGWLRKEEGGSGGTHVQDAPRNQPLAQGQYYQRVIEGKPISMLFAANGNDVKVVGFNQQWVAPILGKPYRYGGIVGHANLPEDIKSSFDAKMAYFQSNPKHPSLNTKILTIGSKKLKELGVDQIYEFYINRKDYRCVFYVIHNTKEIIIAYIGNHTQVKNKF